MKTHLRQFWIARAPRERMVLITLAAILAVALYLWLAYSAEHARSKLRSTVTALRAQSVHIDEQAAEIVRQRATPAPTASHSDLRALIEAQAGGAGLSHALVRVESQGADQVQVVFGGIAFADWLVWVASLQSQHIRLETCRVEALSAAGLVSAIATLVRAK